MLLLQRTRIRFPTLILKESQLPVTPAPEVQTVLISVGVCSHCSQPHKHTHTHECPCIHAHIINKKHLIFLIRYKRKILKLKGLCLYDKQLFYEKRLGRLGRCMKPSVDLYQLQILMMENYGICCLGLERPSDEPYFMIIWSFKLLYLLFIIYITRINMRNALELYKIWFFKELNLIVIFLGHLICEVGSIVAMFTLHATQRLLFVM